MSKIDFIWDISNDSVIGPMVEFVEGGCAEDDLLYAGEKFKCDDGRMHENYDGSITTVYADSITVVVTVTTNSRVYEEIAESELEYLHYLLPMALEATKVMQTVVDDWISETFVYDDSPYDCFDDIDDWFDDFGSDGTEE